MDISSNNQLVPYNQGPRQLTPYSPREKGSVAADGYSAAKRYVLMPPSHSPGHKIHSGDQDLIYGSSRQFKALETNQVGLRIDIYAQLEAVSKPGFWFNPPAADRGGTELNTTGIHQYFEDLKPTKALRQAGKRSTDKDIYPPLADWANRQFWCGFQSFPPQHRIILI